ncbi:hypothetical protein DYB38_005771 [Aphanomyces astaci]|uniref:VLRF1 domain-containing protein n=1 Tax=Aphanomyces astaci TaxID=112090 RepID=A0A397CUU5_APHAT|nr:hypothetical protein DYB38_005771 [Aphanomyces astaci]RHY53487.1 hypothetical protein DYB34_006159 [Aphanomyces astaci]
MQKQYGRIPLWQVTATDLAKWRPVYGEQKLAKDDTSSTEVVDGGASATASADAVVPVGNPDVRGLTCGTCRLEFSDVKSQQAHFKSDFHVYNLKRKSKGLECVSEDDFSAFLASSQARRRRSVDAGNETEDDAPHPLDISLSSDDDDDDETNVLTAKEPLQAFTDSTVVYKVYNAAFSTWSDKIKGPWVASMDMLQALTQPSSTFQWAVLLFRAGRFAGAVFRKDKVLVHKAFQRYTTRRKQGGSQSAHDASSGKAKSAGAQLRRYNEVALQQDMVDLMQSWATELRGCDRIFLGSAKTSRGHFFDKTGLSAADPRLRLVPFGTLRPTYDEVVCRVRAVLGSVHFSPYRASEFEAKPKPISASVTHRRPKHVPDATPSPVDEEERSENVPLPPPPPTPELIQAVESGEVASLTALLANVDVNAQHTDGSARTALHVAVQLNQIAATEVLLQHGASPCALDDRQRVPYVLTTSKEMRNVFRRFRADAPDRWDYVVAKVPDALTDEMEDAQKARAKEKKKRAAERKKEAKAVEAEAKRVQEAAAADAAARRAKESACAACGQPSGTQPFSRLTYLYCSTTCVHNHKRQLMADAALKRFGN